MVRLLVNDVYPCPIHNAMVANSKFPKVLTNVETRLLGGLHGLIRSDKGKAPLCHNSCPLFLSSTGGADGVKTWRVTARNSKSRSFASRSPPTVKVGPVFTGRPASRCLACTLGRSRVENVDFPLSHKQPTAMFSGEFKRFEYARILKRLKLAVSGRLYSGACRSFSAIRDRLRRGMLVNDEALLTG